MDKSDIVLQLALKAMELGYLKYPLSRLEGSEKAEEEIGKMVSNLYNVISQGIRFS